MTRVSGSGLLGAGVLTAGVTAAVLAGAGAASADTADGTDPGPKTPTTEQTSSEQVASPDEAKPQIGKTLAKKPGESRSARRSDRQERTDRSALRASRASRADASVSRDEPAARPLHAISEAIGAEIKANVERAVNNPLASIQRDVTRRLTSLGADRKPVAEAKPKTAVVVPEPAGNAARAAEDRLTPTEALPIVGDVLGPFQPNYPPLVRAVGSAVFNLVGAVVQIADGPPTVPTELRDSIQVKSSTLEIAPGNEVAADWYYPTSGTPPQRMIYLQHGILASGPMYSYTAAYLAERTNSVVVVTTVTSNPFADDGMWLGGDNMHKATAKLFLDEKREALNASFTEAAGPQSFAMPKQFVLVGHSLGGGFVPGVAGHYADGLVARRADGQDAENELAGVVMLDAVPFSPILPNAMKRLSKLEESGDPNDYVPVYEIGAPLNYLNSLSSVNGELMDARPRKFNGVVINGGVHMDGMLGGNPLIQAAAYLVAGVPQPQNPPAVQLLMAGWINDMFEENIDPATGRCLETNDCAGDYGDPGDTIPITDGNGASAVVIGPNSLSPIEWLLNVFHPVTATTPVLPDNSRPMIPLTIAV